MISHKIFILFDTEFTAWEGSQERNWSLEWEYRELISVSALKVELKENKLSIIEKFNLPRDPFSTRLTSKTSLHPMGINAL